MLYIVTGILAVAAAVLWVRHRRLVRGIRELSAAIARRAPYLEETGLIPRRIGSWKSLVDRVNALVADVSRLDHQQAGQLDQLETTLGSLHEAVLVLDRENYILLANNAFRDIFAKGGDVVGKRIEGVLGSREFLAFVDAVRRGEAEGRHEIEFAGVGDRAVWVQVTGAEVRPSREGHRRWTLLVLHDITRLRELEKVRKEFVANVSHELKTPLSVIKGYAETLVDEHNIMAAEDRDRFLKAIYRHAVRLAAIVDDLLTLSRLESDAKQPELEERDLGRYLRGLREEFGQRLHGTGHRLVIELPKSGPLVVRFDPLRMAQVFSNLIDNAQKYCPPETTITVGVRRREGEVEIFVADDGPGIPRSDLPRIFERFYRVEKGRSRESGGTGLGLSIVKHIIQMHGGRIWAESEVGRGTRICFTLPTAGPARAEADSVGFETGGEVASGSA